MVRNGGSVAWSDAIFPLSEYLKGVPARSVFSVDWGFEEQLRMLSKNKLPVHIAEDPINKPALTEEDRRNLLELVSGDGNVFVTHCKGLEFYPGLAGKLAEFAGKAGYRRENLAVISDSYGRPTFRVFRFRKTARG
jgi:hypothetical protein